MSRFWFDAHEDTLALLFISCETICNCVPPRVVMLRVFLACQDALLHCVNAPWCYLTKVPPATVENALGCRKLASLCHFILQAMTMHWEAEHR